MYGFLLRPKWIAFHLLVLGAIALMVWLGFWQLRRLDERKAFNAVVAERAEEPPVPLDDLLAGAGDDIDSLEWRQVTVSGTWVPDQVVWYNRSQDGLAGDNVLTALAEADGSVVVVNRGFVPLTDEVPAAPGGDVQVLGRVQIASVPVDGGEATPGGAQTVTEMRRVDLSVLDAQLTGPVAPVYLDLVASVPAVADTGPYPTPLPELDEGPHLSYAMQWFIFSVAVLVGWVLAIRRSIATRRHESANGSPEPCLTDGADERTPTDSPPADVDATTTAPT